jgi:hypothetical protein
VNELLRISRVASEVVLVWRWERVAADVELRDPLIRDVDLERAAAEDHRAGR